MSAEKHIDTHTSQFRIFNEIVRLRYDYDIEGKEQIDKIRTLQEEYKSSYGTYMPMLDIWNHEGTADPAIAGHFTATQLGDMSSGILIPVSHHYATTDAYPIYRIGVTQGRKAGYMMPEIDQSYRGRDELLTEYEKSEFDKTSGKRALQFIRLVASEFEKGALVSIAPEGHRSETLNPPEKGAGTMVSMMEKLIKSGRIGQGMIIPRGIFKYPGNNKLTVKMGEPICPQNIIEQAMCLSQRYNIEYDASLNSHVLMLLVRDLLPRHMHGVYDEDLPEEYKRKIFNNDIKLVTERRTVNGKLKNTVILRDFTENYDPGIFIPPIRLFGRKI